MIVGRKANPIETLAVKHGLMVTATSDPRINDATVMVSAVGNSTTASFSIFPVGMAGNRPVSAVVGGV
jgi:hypothetical protein